jgi:glycosyltransferase involved in cell wall biosynthesis
MIREDAHGHPRDAQPYRHCMIVHAYFPTGETRVQREAEALLASGYLVDVICLRISGEPFHSRVKGTHVFRVPLSRHRDRGFVFQFAEYLLFLLAAMLLVSVMHIFRRYKSIQAHNPPDFLVFSALIPKLLGARIILDIHDLMPEFYMYRTESDDEASLGVRLVILQERLACGFADYVITVSHIWRQSLINRHVPEDKIGVVMNLADDRIFNAGTARNDRGSPSTELRLIYHGLIVERYGLDLVLLALNQLKATTPGIHFTILGTGPYLNSLQACTRELNLTDRVTFLARFRPVEELPAIIMTHDVGVVPYRNDPFTDQLVPTKLLEYAALGLPCIAARTSAIQYYFDENMVEFFAPGQVEDLQRSICRLYTDRDRLLQLSVGVSGFQRKYHWGKHSQEYVNMIRGRTEH